jgi:hypothetical protein
MELKQINFQEKSFQANGKEYLIEKELSIQRSVYAEQCKIELETGLRVGKQLDDWTKVYDLANERRFADIVVLAHNNRRAFKNFFEEHHPILKLCACFLNSPEEDRRIITDSMVAAKIKDWAEEGYAMSSFFELALSFLKTESGDYRSALESVAELIKEFHQRRTQEELNTPIIAS